MFNPSFRVLFPKIADRIFLQLPRAILQWAALSLNSVALPEPGLAGLYAPGSYLPSLCPQGPSYRSPYSFRSWAQWCFTTV